MIPAAFEYRAPSTIDEAVAALDGRPGEAKLIAGGHSLLPMMKLRAGAARRPGGLETAPGRVVPDPGRR